MPRGPVGGAAGDALSVLLHAVILKSTRSILKSDSLHIAKA